MSHPTRVIPVPHDSDPLVDDRYQAVCLRDGCPWSSDLWDTEGGAYGAAQWHEENADRLSGEHPTIDPQESGET